MTQHARALLVRLVTTVLAVVGVGLAPTLPASTANAAVGDVGYVDFRYGAPLTGPFIDPDLSPTASKPQSKLWFAQDTWWGVLQLPDTTTTAIHSYNASTHQWTSTGVVVDSRTTPTQADVLWDGANGKLFIVSSGRPGSASGIRVSRFRYDTGSRTYVPDGLATGALSSAGVEAAVIAKDSTGRLWVAYTAGAGSGRVVRLLVSDPAQTTFQATFTPPVGGTTVTSDDIATIVAHDQKVSVVWSNQTADAAGNTAVYVAQHPDTAAPDTGWTASQKIFSGPNAADDHISLASAEGAPQGGVFVAVKEAADDAGAVESSRGLVRLLVLRPSGAWENHVHSTVSDDMTRPIVLLEPSANRVHVFATSPVAGGTVYRKTSAMNSISFTPGRGEAFLKFAEHSFVNNPTSTKQHVTAASGILVLASDQRTAHYVHNHVTGTAPPPPPARPVANFTHTPTTGTAPLAVRFTDTSTGAPTTWAWDFGDGGRSTAQNPSHTYTTAGSYTVTLRVSNGGGASTKTSTVTVTAPPPARPVANFTHTPTTGTAPLAVRFTDTSTGAPTSWAWDFGDGGRSTAQNPSHTFTKEGTFTVRLTVSRGSDSSTKTAPITVSRASTPGPSQQLPVTVLDEPDTVFARSPYVHAAWHTTTDPSEVADFDVQFYEIAADRRARWSERLLTDQRSSSLRMDGRPGSTYCLRVRATNTDGGTGTWSATRCTAVPLDDREMSRSGGWRAVTSDEHFMGTALRTRARGASLSRTVTGKQVSLLVTRGPGGGRVLVYKGNRLIKRVSLRAARTSNKVLVPIASQDRVRTARYRIVVASRNRPVTIDGIAVSRN